MAAQDESAGSIEKRGDEGKVRCILCPPEWQEACDLNQIPWVEVSMLRSQGSDVSHAKRVSLELRRLDPQSRVFSPMSLLSRGVPHESDLVPGSYGGGYKVWECSLDLVEYVLALPPSDFIKSVSPRMQSDGVKILELGCGHGLPGLASFVHLNGESLYLADLNDGVLEDVTWPNILLNCTHERSQNIQCLSGDWLRLPERLMREEGSRPFDVILSAETLYTQENCRHILYILKECLSENGGIALLANKRYYFGVGGGTNELLQIAVAEFPRVFEISRVKEFVDGNSNIRDILSVKLTT